MSTERAYRHFVLYVCMYVCNRSGADGPEWKRAVNYDDLAGPPGRGRDGPGGGGGRGRGGGGRNGGRGGGRGGRAPPVKKSWWTSEFNKMDGELDLPLPWWATRVEMDYEEMKVCMRDGVRVRA